MLKAKLLFNKVKLTYEIEDNDITLNNPKDLIYLLIKTVDLIINQKAANINIKVKKRDREVVFEIITDTKLQNININELKLLNKNEQINILIQDNFVIFEING